MSPVASDRWSLPLGNCWGLSLRAHLSLLLAAVLVVASTAQQAPVGGLILLGVLITSSVLHEAAHQVIAYRLAGQRQPIVLTPMGGLRQPSVASDPEVQLLVGMVGPLVNLAIVVLSAGALAYGAQNLGGVFALTGPAPLFAGPWYVIVMKCALWVNWLSFLLSLIPTFPFDGGPALRAALWPLFGQRTAAVFSAQLARIIGLSLGVAAAYVLHESPGDAFTLAAPLGAIAVVVVCSSQHELSLAWVPAGTLSSGLHEALPAPVGARHSPSDEGGLLLDEAGPDSWVPSEYDPEDDRQEDDAVDEILARIHTHGPQDLSEEDRRVLERASRRYRHRRGGASHRD